MKCSLSPYQGIVKRFFNEKEVTSTLVMDALYSGCRQLEAASAPTAQVQWLARPEESRSFKTVTGKGRSNCSKH